MGIWIAIVFAIAARCTRASRVEVLGAMLAVSLPGP